MSEKTVWESYINKDVSLMKQVEDRTYFFKGIIIEVLDNKIILDDRKLGEIPLTLDGLSIIDIRGDAE